jgi:hypothetical protein
MTDNDPVVLESDDDDEPQIVDVDPNESGEGMTAIDLTRDDDDESPVLSHGMEELFENPDEVSRALQRFEEYRQEHQLPPPKPRQTKPSDFQKADKTIQMKRLSARQRVTPEQAKQAQELRKKLQEERDKRFKERQEQQQQGPSGGVSTLVDQLPKETKILHIRKSGKLEFPHNCFVVPNGFRLVFPAPFGHNFTLAELVETEPDDTLEIVFKETNHLHTIKLRHFEEDIYRLMELLQQSLDNAKTRSELFKSGTNVYNEYIQLFNDIQTFKRKLLKVTPIKSKNQIKNKYNSVLKLQKESPLKSFIFRVMNASTTTVYLCYVKRYVILVVGYMNLFLRTLVNDLYKPLIDLYNDFSKSSKSKRSKKQEYSLAAEEASWFKVMHQFEKYNEEHHVVKGYKGGNLCPDFTLSYDLPEDATNAEDILNYYIFFDDNNNTYKIPFNKCSQRDARYRPPYTPIKNKVRFHLSDFVYAMNKTLKNRTVYVWDCSQFLHMTPMWMRDSCFNNFELDIEKTHRFSHYKARVSLATSLPMLSPSSGTQERRPPTFHVEKQLQSIDFFQFSDAWLNTRKKRHKTFMKLIMKNHPLERDLYKFLHTIQYAEQILNELETSELKDIFHTASHNMCHDVYPLTGLNYEPLQYNIIRTATNPAPESVEIVDVLLRSYIPIYAFLFIFTKALYKAKMSRKEDPNYVVLLNASWFTPIPYFIPFVEDGRFKRLRDQEIDPEYSMAGVVTELLGGIFRESVSERVKVEHRQRQEYYERQKNDEYIEEMYSDGYNQFLLGPLVPCLVLICMQHTKEDGSFDQSALTGLTSQRQFNQSVVKIIKSFFTL